MNEIRNDFERNMIDNGYKIYKNNFNGAIRSFQKRFDDQLGKKYFISIHQYNHAEQFNRSDIPNQDSYTADTQFRFNKQGKDQTCNIEFWGDVTPNEWREVTTLEDIERFFEKAWLRLEADYYEQYD